MEAIFIILWGVVQLVLGVAAAVGSMILTFIGAIVQSIVGITMQTRRSRKHREAIRTGSPPEPKPMPKWLKKVLACLCCLTLVLVAILAVINFFFFEPVIGRVFTSQLKRNGVEASYETLEGNLFVGKIKLSNLALKSKQWQVGLDNLDTQIDPFSLLSSSISIKKLHFDGLNADIKMPPPEPDRKTKSDKRKDKKRFEILDLNAADIDVQLAHTDGTKPPIHSIEMDHLRAEKFRSKYALFYVFFRSNIQGKINGQSLSVSVEDRKPRGKRTRWKVEALPLQPLWSENPWFIHFEDGTVDLNVTDEWLIDGRVEIDMDWRLTFADVKAVAPPKSTTRAALATYLNDQADPIEIQFGLKMDPDNFDGSSSEAANELYKSVMNAMAISVAKRFSVDKQDIEGRQKKSIDAIKGVFDRVRKERLKSK